MTLGQLFRQKREESGRSLEQLAALTKIHIKILTALEADSYADLPARAFTRGFIVNYAKALKLNPDEVLKEYQESMEQHFSERKDRDRGHQGYVFEGKELEQNRRWMIIGASIAVVFAAATVLVFKPQNHKHKEMHKEFEDEAAQTNAGADSSDGNPPPPTLLGTPTQRTSPTVAESIAANSSVSSMPTLSEGAKATAAPKTTPTPKPKPTATATATPVTTVTPAPSPETTASPSPTPKEDKLNKGDELTKKDTQYKITFQAKEDVWIRYQADSKPVMTIILRKGRMLVIKAKTKIAYETLHPEALKYKTKGGFSDLEIKKGTIADDATLQDAQGAELGSKPIHEEVPAPAAH